LESRSSIVKVRKMQKPTIPRRFTSAVYQALLPPVNGSGRPSTASGRSDPSPHLSQAAAGSIIGGAEGYAMDREFRRMDLLLTVTLLLLLGLTVLLIANLIGAINVYG
jgi:hypothetical protein